MPRLDHSDITLLLDRSGSMATIADDTVGGVATFIEDQKKLPGSADFTLIQFDHEYMPVHNALPIASVPAFTRNQFNPRGNTAMLDAIGRSITETGQRLAAKPEDQRPTNVIFVIVTDGLENRSVEFPVASGGRERIASMIKHQQEAYNWRFLFLAANQDAVATGAGLAIPTGQSMSFAPNHAGTGAAYAATSGGVGMIRSGRSFGYSEEDRKTQRAEGAQ